MLDGSHICRLPILLDLNAVWSILRLGPKILNLTSKANWILGFRCCHNKCQIVFQEARAVSISCRASIM